jgi:hypothetical protein
MDVEKAIEFILQSQARMQAAAEAEAVRAKEESVRVKEETARGNERAAQSEKEIAAIRQILQETAFIQQEQARILVRLETNLTNLTAAQQVTETKLQAFIDSLGRGTNGGNGKKQ